MRSKQEIRDEIIKLVDEYYENFHTVKPYKEGDRIPYAGRCFGKEYCRCFKNGSVPF